MKKLYKNKPIYNRYIDDIGSVIEDISRCASRYLKHMISVESWSISCRSINEINIILTIYFKGNLSNSYAFNVNKYDDMYIKVIIEKMLKDYTNKINVNPLLYRGHYER